MQEGKPREKSWDLLLLGSELRLCCPLHYSNLQSLLHCNEFGRHLMLCRIRSLLKACVLKACSVNHDAFGKWQDLSVVESLVGDL